MTPTPVPVLVSVADLAFVQTNYLPVLGAVWAVLLLFVLTIFAGSDKIRDLTEFFILCVVAAPVVLISAGWWALTIYVFWLLLRIVSALYSLVKR